MKNFPQFLSWRIGGTIVILGLLAFASIARADELVARIITATPKYHLQPVDGLAQRLDLPSDASIEWVVDAGDESFGDGLLTLTLPIPPGSRLRVEREVQTDGKMKLSLYLLTLPPRQTVATSPTPTPPADSRSRPAPPTSLARSSPHSSVAPSSAAPSVDDTAPPAASSPSHSPTPALSDSLLTEFGLTSESAALLAQVQDSLAEGVNFDPAAKADFAIPSSPAASILQSDTEILSPTTPRETVTTVLSNFDEEGKLKSGFSIAVTPYTLFRKGTVSLRDYNEKPHVRFLTRLQISMAAKASETDDSTSTSTDSPTSFGIGLSGVFFDHSDLRTDPEFRRQLNQQVQPLAEKLAELHAAIAKGTIDEVPDVSQDYLDQYTKLRDARTMARWNKAAMGFGLAMRLRSPTGKVDDAEDDGAAAWLNLALPGIGIFEDNSQFLFAATYRHDDFFERDGVTGRESSFNLGAQWRFGLADFHGYAETFYHWRKPDSGNKYNELTLELGLERRLFENLWFNLAWSNDDSLSGGDVIKGSLRYGFGKAASLNGK